MEETAITLRLKLLFLGCLLSLLPIFAPPAQAATQYVSPSSGTFAVGSTFSIGVYTSSPDQPASAFSGYLSFPVDKLTVTSLSKNGSVISVWVQEPTYSNSTGTLGFEGFIPNPGYTGTGGKLLTITFQVKAAGTAAVNFTSVAVLANDGYGTNITTGSGSGTFTLGEVVAPEEEETPPVPGLPPAPSITSSTHPDQNAWYANNDPSFSLGLPRGTTGVNVLANQTAGSDPGTTSDGLNSTYEYSDVDDGIWYFHARLRNDQGWGGVSHYRFQIDTVAPEPFSLGLQPPADSKAQPEINFFTTDSLSGLDHYLVILGDQEAINVPAAEIISGQAYVLPAQTAGVHTVTVQAVDKAGNISSASLQVTFTGTLESLEDGGAQGPQVTRRGAGLIDMVEYGLAGFLGLLVIAALIFALFIAQHLYRDHWKFVSHQKVNGQSRLHHNLARIRHDLRSNLRHLEATRRVKHLSENSERIIRSTSRALKELEEKVTRAMEDV